MFGIGGNELLLILLFAFLIFGPDKLPKAGRTIGRAMRQFKNAQDEMNKVIKTEVYDPLTDKDPLKNPFDSNQGAKKKSNSVQEAAGEETFAERKARMTREKEAARKAREEAEAAKGGAAPSKADALYGNKPKPAQASDVAKPAAANATAKAAQADKPSSGPASKADAPSASGEEGGASA